MDITHVQSKIRELTARYNSDSAFRTRATDDPVGVLLEEGISTDVVSYLVRTDEFRTTLGAPEVEGYSVICFWSKS